MKLTKVLMLLSAVDYSSICVATRFGSQGLRNYFNSHGTEVSGAVKEQDEGSHEVEGIHSFILLYT